MNYMKNFKILLIFILFNNIIISQNYFLESHEPYDNSILSPEEFLGYEIGFQHTRHDQIVSYLTYLSSVSDKANLIDYGKTHEGRKLVMLCVSSKNNLENIDFIKKEHLKYVNPKSEIENGDGVSHKKDGGLKIEFNWEKQNNNQFMVSASLK